MNMPTAAPPVRPRGNPQSTNMQKAAPIQRIPFCRASRRKSIQAFDQTFTLSAGGITNIQPIQLTPAGFLADLEVYITLSSTGNAATVALGATTDAPWNVINNLQCTNAAGDALYVGIPGYQLYLINKYSGIYQPPFCDPRADQTFSAITTGAGATAGSGAFMIRIPFQVDPRDAFCALPNLAANKAYQLVLSLSALSTIFAGGTAPNGTVTCQVTIVMNYWAQPNDSNGDGLPQMTAPEGVGSVGLWRYQTINVAGGGARKNQLVNVGNVIRWEAFTLYNNATPSVRVDSQWPTLNYLRLNNDQLFYKPTTFWLSEMRQRYGYGSAAGAKDVAGALDTGVYSWSDFNSQHGHVTVDGPRDQFLVTLDATFLELEGNAYGATANTLYVLSHEIKPSSAAALYSINAT